jgi:hypothetical protein
MYWLPSTFENEEFVVPVMLTPVLTRVHKGLSISGVELSLLQLSIQFLFSSKSSVSILPMSGLEENLLVPQKSFLGFQVLYVTHLHPYGLARLLAEGWTCIVCG